MSNVEESPKQRLLRAICNTFFGLLVAAVLLLTVIAVTYQPPDPWLDDALSSSVVQMKQLFDRTIQNATFQTSGSLLLTGEDDSAAASNVSVPAGDAADDGSISQAVAEAAAEKAMQVTEEQQLKDQGKRRGEGDSGGCSSSSPEGIDISINCSDPGVLAAIEKINLEKFPEISSFEYRIPVQGSDERSCDVAWKYRPKKEKSRRMYRDFRRYSLFLLPSCAYGVAEVGDWHSGKNARLQKFRGINAFNDTVNLSPVIPPHQAAEEDHHPATIFTNNARFLYYSRSGDYCKGMNQFMWSFLCALGEAQYLNRTLVVDLDFCLSAKDNLPDRGDQPGKDLRFYIDFDHLKDSASVIDKGSFTKQLNQPGGSHHRIKTKKIQDNLRTTPMSLKQDQSAIIERRFDHQEEDNYWFRVCEGEAEKAIQRPWGSIWKSKRLMNIVNTICGKLEWDFDAIRVVRGEKATNTALWPNLARDTTPEAILRKVDGRLSEKRFVYVSSNERRAGFFDKLKEKYSVSVLEDFRELWGPGSEWFNETMALTKGKEVEFDGYMREAVDSEMFLRGKKRIETFGDLTSDCKDGVNSC